MPKLFTGVRGRLILVAVLAGLILIFALRPRAAQIPMMGGPPSIVGRKPLGSLSGATGWINSKPLTAKDLRGKVVLIDFWAYSCINCLRSMPYIEAWANKYKSSGLVVIGVHTPEFGFGHKLANVQHAVERYGITFPVALDSNHNIWNAFNNQYWPADYFIGVDGKVRYEHFGEGNYAESEHWIQNLLKQRNLKSMPEGVADVQGHGAEAPADFGALDSPETYIGYARAARFTSPGGIKRDMNHVYTLPKHPGLNEWGLEGKWSDRPQVAILKSPGGKIIFRFHARDLNLVLGPASDGKPIHFRVTLDGHAPGADHGVDTDAAGNGVVKTYRMYQLIRQKGKVRTQNFVIEFEEPGVQAFSFTFG